MKPVLPLKFLVPIGLLLLSASFILKHYTQLPDVADGFLKGLSIGILFLSLVTYAKGKSAA